MSNGSSCEKCPDCGHSLKDNNHGFDQNDGYIDGYKFVHYGHCTYCRICNPRIFGSPDELAEPKETSSKKDKT